jgi:hypothetical protein
VEDVASSRNPVVNDKDEVEPTALPGSPAASKSSWVSGLRTKSDEYKDWEYINPEQRMQEQEPDIPKWILSSRKKLDEDSTWEFVQQAGKYALEQEPTPEGITLQGTTGQHSGSSQWRPKAATAPEPATNQQNGATLPTFRGESVNVANLEAAIDDLEELLAASRHLRFERFKLGNPNVRYKDFDMIDAFWEPPE